MRDKLPPERQARLEALKGWAWNPNDQAWESGYARLAEYSEDHGNCLVPISFKLPDGYSLGTWVAKQRSTRHNLPPERQARLQALKGWTWNANDEAWENGYARLVQYSAANSNCLVTQTFKLPDGYSLGTWVAKQRSTRDKLPPERQARLEALKGWAWKVRD